MKYEGGDGGGLGLSVVKLKKLPSKGPALLGLTEKTRKISTCKNFYL